VRPPNLQKNVAESAKKKQDKKDEIGRQWGGGWEGVVAGLGVICCRTEEE